MVSVATLLVCALGAPGLLAAPLVMLAGFSRGNRAIVALGALSLVSYLIFFYYNLDLTLLKKSLSLMTSGVALLVAWAALGWLAAGDKGRRA